MQPITSYLSEYAESHKNPTNQWIHTICVPLITWSILGALHTIVIIDGLHASHLFVVLALAYYSFFRKALIVAAMALMSAIFLFSFNWIPNLLWTSIIVFVIAWIGQFYGHHIEGKRPSFLTDVTFLLIGPVWVIKKFFPKIDAY